MVGIVDEALPMGDDDALEISVYKDALVEFIKNTETPMTVGVQGQWGSGKTSLLYQIWDAIESSNKNDSEIDDFKQIWINSWEHSLLCSPEECLMKIINEIILELVKSDVDKSKKDKLSAGVSNIMKGALRIGSSLTLGSAGVDVVDDIFSNDSNSIKELRQQLTDLVSEIKQLESNSFGKVIIYVDDLDRILPKDAVAILELLKNIFNIKDCVFVLAIDYEVVVKGLEHKYGDKTPENEWEFKAFFDKIIQLPFRMPMSSYNISSYVLDLLQRISFYEGEESLDEDLIRDFVKNSIGDNPRSIKRLINSLSLIQIVNGKQEGSNSDGTIKDKDEALTMFAVVCLQGAYPEIYQMLVDKPNFLDDWDEKYAENITQKKEEQSDRWKENFKLAITTENFDEKWEQCLFRVCYLNPKLRKEATQISQFLSTFINEFEKEKVITLIENALGQAAVTSVGTNNNPNIRPPKGSYKRHYNDGYDQWIERIKEDNSKFDNFPNEDQKNLFKIIIDTIKDAPFNAEDDSPNAKSDYTIKYAGGLSIYFKGKKIFSIWPSAKKAGFEVFMEFYKNPKDDNKPLFLKKSGIQFTHLRSLKDFDIEKREYKGSYGFVSWMSWVSCPFIFNDYNLTKDTFKFIFEYSTDALVNYKDEMITEKQIAEHIENFKNGRKGSTAFNNSIDFLRNHFDENNIKEVDH